MGKHVDMKYRAPVKTDRFLKTIREFLQGGLQLHLHQYMHLASMILLKQCDLHIILVDIDVSLNVKLHSILIARVCENEERKNLNLTRK